jgi:endo-1,3(4)-beta-glucanase
MMTGVVGDRWELNEPDVATIGQVGYTAVRDVPANKRADILDALKKDVAGLKSDKPDQNSWYNAGKHFMRAANFAVVADVLGEAELRTEVVSWYKTAVAPFVDGTIPNRIVYETSWKGVVSRKGMDDSGADYGNGYYNDHHYHWGYFLSANSIIAKFDADFKTKISAWMDTLVRDVMNPSASDTKFPVFRSFDWFVGSCWSQGIFASADGKDEESTSEEINMHYGIMLWGRTSGKADILRLGQLSIAVAARTIRRYFLMTADNDIHPKVFIGNKVTGIKFENKVDYATWFGANTEFKHGIQMIPPLPVTEYVRTRKFAKEEWQLIGPVSDRVIAGGGANAWWGTVLLWSQALFDRDAAFNKMKTAPYDPGMSKTWSLYFAATAPPP